MTQRLGAEAFLADLGAAADELKVGIVRIEKDQIELMVTRNKMAVRVMLQMDDYRPLSGDVLRAVIRPPEGSAP